MSAEPMRLSRRHAPIHVYVYIDVSLCVCISVCVQYSAGWRCFFRERVIYTEQPLRGRSSWLFAFGRKETDDGPPAAALDSIQLSLSFFSVCNVCPLSARYEAKYVVPMVNATLIASGSVGGILLFEEYAHMPNTSIYAFASGSFLVVMGILILTTAASGAVSKAAQPEYIAKRIRELGCDGTEDER